MVFIRYLMFAILVAIAFVFGIIHRSALLPRLNAMFHKEPGGVVYFNGLHDRTISHLTIQGGSKPCIALINCYNVTIADNKLLNSSDVGVRLYNCRNIHIYANYFNNLSAGVYAERSAGGHIQVDHNQLLNMQGPYPRGQFIQFNGINGPANLICYNHCENIRGKSNPEDGISLYKCNGMPNSKIVIKGNWIRGGGPSKSGGGIMLGDNGGSYQTASENILVDPGQYGIAISGGDHNSIVGNFIYGRSQSFTNVGVYVASYNGAVCSSVTVSGNKVRYYNSKNALNNFWLGPGVQQPAGWLNNTDGAQIDEHLLPSAIIKAK